MASSVATSGEGIFLLCIRFSLCLRASVVGFALPDPCSSAFIRGKVSAPRDFGDPRLSLCLRASVVGFAFLDPRSSAFIHGKVLLLLNLRRLYW